MIRGGVVPFQSIKDYEQYDSGIWCKMEGNKACILRTKDVYRCRCKVGWNTLYIYTKDHAGPSGSRATPLFLTISLERAGSLLHSRIDATRTSGTTSSRILR